MICRYDPARSGSVPKDYLGEYKAISSPMATICDAPIGMNFNKIQSIAQLFLNLRRYESLELGKNKIDSDFSSLINKLQITSIMYIKYSGSYLRFVISLHVKKRVFYRKKTIFYSKYHII